MWHSSGSPTDNNTPVSLLPPCVWSKKNFSLYPLALTCSRTPSFMTSIVWGCLYLISTEILTAWALNRSIICYSICSGGGPSRKTMCSRTKPFLVKYTKQVGRDESTGILPFIRKSTHISAQFLVIPLILFTWRTNFSSVNGRLKTALGSSSESWSVEATGVAWTLELHASLWLFQSFRWHWTEQ